MAPWRLTAHEALELSLAVDGRAGDETAAAEAREVVDGVVEPPAQPGVRLLAADVELLLRNFPATQAWIRDQLATFPYDSVTVPAAEAGLAPRLIDAARLVPRLRSHARNVPDPRWPMCVMLHPASPTLSRTRRAGPGMRAPTCRIGTLPPRPVTGRGGAASSEAVPKPPHHP